MKSFKRYLIENIDVRPGDTEFKSVYAGKRHHEAENDGRWLGTPYEVPDSEDTAEEQENIDNENEAWRKKIYKAHNNADERNATAQNLGSAVIPAAAWLDLNAVRSGEARNRSTPLQAKGVKAIIKNVYRHIPSPFGPRFFTVQGAIEAIGHLANVTTNEKTGDNEWTPQYKKAAESVATNIAYYQAFKHILPRILPAVPVLATAAVPGYLGGMALAKAADYVLGHPDNDGFYDRIIRSDTYNPKTWLEGGQETGKGIARMLGLLPSIEDETKSKLPQNIAQVKKDKTERANQTNFNTTPRSHSSAGAPVAAGTVKNSNGQIMYQ